jgi:hypothetical protein
LLLCRRDDFRGRDDHIAWVKALAERLRNTGGVDVILDRWDLLEGHDKHAFMEQMVTNPDIRKVLIVSDELYADKADGRRGGVGTETMIISSEVYEKAKQEKFVPLVREWKDDGERKKPCLPAFLKSRKYIDFSDTANFEDSFERLIRNIHGRPEEVKPPLGPPPAHIFIESTIHVKTAGRLESLKNAVMKDKPHVQPLLQDYFDTFIDALEDFRLDHDRNHPTPWDQRVMDSIISFIPYRNNFIDFATFFASYIKDEDSGDKLFDFLERIIPFRDRPPTMNTWHEEAFDNFRFIQYQLFLYLIAILIKAKRYEDAAKLIEGEYHFPSRDSNSRYHRDGCDAFNNGNRTLDEYRANRLKLNTYSVSADYISENATYGKIPFTLLFQADVLLFLRPFFPAPGAIDQWYPYLSPFAYHAGASELFSRATSETGIKALRILLKVKDIKHLWSVLQSLRTNSRFHQLCQSRPMHRVDWDTVLNMNGIRHAAEPPQK